MPFWQRFTLLETSSLGLQISTKTRNLSQG
jgi:hypothetical protein